MDGLQDNDHCSSWGYGWLDCYIWLFNKNFFEIFFKKRKLGPGAVAQVVKVLALHARDPIWAPVLIPAAPLPIQLTACGPGKQWRTAQSFGTLHPRERPERVSCLRICIVSAVALTWAVNHRTEDLPLCLSSLYIHLSNKKIIIKVKS